MDLSIHLLLIQDGISTGAIYALLAMALVLVFTVTRIIFIPQGEFVAYGALSLAFVQGGHVPPTIWFLVALGAATTLTDSVIAVRENRKGAVPGIVLVNTGLPLLLAGLLHALPLASLPLIVQIVLTLAIIVPLGPMIYRLAFQPVAEGSVLLLLIVAVAVHLMLLGLGLLSGVGFTMSLFIASLAFSEDGDLFRFAVLGVLSASLVAAIAGYLWLRVVLPAHAGESGSK